MNPDYKMSILDADFINEIKRIVNQARQKAYTAINSAMVEAYWQLGKRIVEQEQQGKDRADYGTQLLKSLSKELTAEFGKGFSTGSLYYYRQFYVTFPEIFATPWRILTWSHYKRLLQVRIQCQTQRFETQKQTMFQGRRFGGVRGIGVRRIHKASGVWRCAGLGLSLQGSINVFLQPRAEAMLALTMPRRELSEAKVRAR